MALEETGVTPQSAALDAGAAQQRDHLAHQPGDRSDLPVVRARSGRRGAVAPVRRSRDLRARLDPGLLHISGDPGSWPRGEGRPGDTGRAVRGVAHGVSGGDVFDSLTKYTYSTISELAISNR